MTHEGADAHIDKLARKYLGKDFPGRLEGQVRVIVRVRTDHIAIQG
jgi:hypothetical protein